MVKRKNGLIIFFSSVATKINQEGSSSYSASKSGIETFSQVLSKELKKYRIKVHTLRIIFFPTRLSKGLNKAGLNNILVLEQDFIATKECHLFPLEDKGPDWKETKGKHKNIRNIT